MSAVRAVIVEDEFLVAFQLEDILLDRGCEIVAIVPDLASVYAIDEPVDIALVDLNLRDGPTGQAAANLLAERFAARIIYVTASAGQIMIPATTAIGIIHKPFSRRSIEEAVNYALDANSDVRRPSELHSVQIDRQRILA